MPELRAHERDDGNGCSAEQETADRRLGPVRTGEARRRALHSAKKGEKHGRDERDDHGQQRVERQMRRKERILRRVGKERRFPEDRYEDRVGHDAREHRWDESLGLEVVAVENLDGEKGCAERSPENGCHAGRGAGHEEDAALAVGDAQVAAR